MQDQSWHEAAAAFRRIVAIDPGSELGWFNLSYALSRACDGPGALEAARKLVEIAPSNLDHRAWLFGLQR
jgi:hypothetical protein